MSKKARLRKRRVALSGYRKARGGMGHRVSFSEKRTLNPRGHHPPRARFGARVNPPAGKIGIVITLPSKAKYRISEYGNWVRIH